MNEKIPREVKVERKVFQLTCRTCGKVVTGNSEDGCLHNLNEHMKVCEKEQK